MMPRCPPSSRISPYGAFSPVREGWHNRTRYRFLAALPPADGDDSYDYPYLCSIANADCWAWTSSASGGLCRNLETAAAVS